jgi:hypothetical protein
VHEDAKTEQYPPKNFSGHSQIAGIRRYMDDYPCVLLLRGELVVDNGQPNFMITVHLLTRNYFSTGVILHPPGADEESPLLSAKDSSGAKLPQNDILHRHFLIKPV